MVKIMEQKYTKSQVILHWTMAFLVSYCMLSALFKGFIPKGPVKTDVMNFHKWFGLLVLLLIFVRIGLRVTFGAPKLDSGNKVQDRLAHIAHFLLYGLMFLIPLFGVIFINLGGYPLTFFGIPLAQLFTENKGLSKVFKELHEIGGFVLIGIVGVHIVAALKHHLLDKDGLLDRMKF